MAAVENDDEKKQFYLDQADTALRNANITNRVNYALDDLGFDTSAVAAQTPFGEDQPVMDYGGLSNRLQSGLEDTKSGRAFLKEHAISKEGDTDYMKRVISDFNQSDLNKILAPTATDADRLYYQSRPELVEQLIAAQQAEKYAEPFDRTVTTTVLPGQEYGVELPAYSDVPTSILEDYGESNVGLIGPGSLEGYTDRDLEEDELYNERLAELIAGVREVDKGLLTQYTNVNPFTTPYVPIEEDPWTETHPDLYDFRERNYGPGGMDIEEEEDWTPSRGLLWEPPWNYQI